MVQVSMLCQLYLTKLVGEIFLGINDACDTSESVIDVFGISNKSILVIPVSQVIPVIPASQVISVIPVSQVIPVIPVSQVIPVIPVSQVIPVIPVSQVIPVSESSNSSRSTDSSDSSKSSDCLLYTSPSPRDATLSRMPSSA